MFLCGMRSPRSRPSSARPICDTRQLSLAGLGSERGAQDARLHQTLPDALRDLSPLSLGAVSRPAQCVACRSALTRTIGGARGGVEARQAKVLTADKARRFGRQFRM